MKRKKKAQVEVTVNWIYVLIAGAVILLFFIGLVVKQKSASEEALSIDLVQLMESIFSGAVVSEETKNFIDTSGLVDYTLYFECEDEKGLFGIEGKPAKFEDNIHPVFAPKKLQTSRLILWSVPYKLPFKVIDLLIVTSLNTKYFLIGDSSFTTEFLNETEGFNVVSVDSLTEIVPGNNYQVRVVDLDGLQVSPGANVPTSLVQLDDDKVTAVSFLGGDKVTYYQKDGSVWKQLHPRPLDLVYLESSKNVAKYAAIFAADDKVYECNMKKAFKRLEYLLEIYGGEDIRPTTVGGKLAEMVEYYDTPEFRATKPDCVGYVFDYPNPENMIGALQVHQGRTEACVEVYDYCADLKESASNIQRLNNLLGINCITLY